MQKKLRKYIKELDAILVKTNEDKSLLAGLISRLEEIEKKSELKHFIRTVRSLADHASTSEEYKFLTKVETRLTTILKD